MKFTAIIPARYASTRFPGKPLADMKGKPMIQRVYERVSQAVGDVWVATDDERIRRAVQDFGGQVVMTDAAHQSGTDRCHEAYTKVAPDADVIINVQGDEPFVCPTQIEALKQCFTHPEVDIATLVKAFRPTDDFESLFNANTPKVVFNRRMEAIYFSRSIIPYVRNHKHTEWLSRHVYYKHIGMYAYRANVLGEITKLPPSGLEVAESLEQLRWLENGYTIKVAVTEVETIGIDTPQDMERALQAL